MDFGKMDFAPTESDVSSHTQMYNGQLKPVCWEFKVQPTKAKDIIHQNYLIYCNCKNEMIFNLFNIPLIVFHNLDIKSSIFFASLMIIKHNLSVVRRVNFFTSYILILFHIWINIYYFSISLIPE